MNLFRVLNNLFRFNRTNWKAVSLCFTAATVFWIFNALNKNYATNVSFPLKFDFDEHKFVPSRPLPQNVYINVSGKGWDLLRKNLGLKLPLLTIPLERPVETRKMVGSTLPPFLAAQLGNLKINHIVTDTLYLSIEPKDSVKVKVIVDATRVVFRNGFGRISPIVILPDSVQFEGPRSAFQRLPDSIVLVLGENRLNENFRERVEVRLSGEMPFKRNPPLVDVMFEVGKVTEIQKRLKLQLVDVPAAARILQETDSIDCILQIPENRINDFDQYINNVKAVINLKDLRSGGRKMLPVVTELPPYATFIRTDSIHIKLY